MKNPSWNSSLTIIAIAVALSSPWAWDTAVASEKLYNGIVLPEEWPPKAEHFSLEPMPVPYLQNPPAVILIDVGRQLFVDDFLIEHTTLARQYHLAEYVADNPVVKPDKPWEKDYTPTFSGGVWHDPQDQQFKMWYSTRAGKHYHIAYATSTDGIQWDKPALDVVPGTNIVLPFDHNASLVWLDQEEKNPQRRFKMTVTPYLRDAHYVISGMLLFFSPDGIHWTESGAGTSWCLDRSTFFRNPFRDVWVYSLKWIVYGAAIGADGLLRIEERTGKDWWHGCARCLCYREHPDIAAGLGWPAGRAPGSTTDTDFLNHLLEKAAVRWTSADFLDPMRNQTTRRTGTMANESHQPELYNLDAVAYESLMLGLFTIFHGDGDGTPGSHEHMNDVTLGYSRDGFHWYRPDRRAFLGVSQRRGDWNWSNVESAGGGCLIVGDRLHFYASGASASPKVKTTGLATLRRDGFVSLDAGSEAGVVVTRPVKFGGRRLFVNADTRNGSLRVEVLTRGGQVIPPYSKENCIAVRADRTLAEVQWRGVDDLAALAGRPVRFRFILENGRFYSFWVSPDENGASHGYVAAGGPGLTGSRDTVGKAATSEKRSKP
jgi:hypothetical protein